MYQEYESYVEYVKDEFSDLITKPCPSVKICSIISRLCWALKQRNDFQILLDIRKDLKKEHLKFVGLDDPRLTDKVIEDFPKITLSIEAMIDRLWDKLLRQGVNEEEIEYLLKNTYPVNESTKKHLSSLRN